MRLACPHNVQLRRVLPLMKAVPLTRTAAATLVPFAAGECFVCRSLSENVVLSKKKKKTALQTDSAYHTTA